MNGSAVECNSMDIVDGVIILTGCTVNSGMIKYNYDSNTGVAIE